jgi:hypothetical protein
VNPSGGASCEIAIGGLNVSEPERQAGWRVPPQPTLSVTVTRRVGALLSVPPWRTKSVRKTDEYGAMTAVTVATGEVKSVVYEASGAGTPAGSTVGAPKVTVMAVPVELAAAMTKPTGVCPFRNLAFWGVETWSPSVMRAV